MLRILLNLLSMYADSIVYCSFYSCFFVLSHGAWYYSNYEQYVMERIVFLSFYTV
jgi:hypothetical protein